VFDYEGVGYVDGLFDASTFVVSARFVCCVEKAYHVAKLRDRVFAPQAFNSFRFYSHGGSRIALRFRNAMISYDAGLNVFMNAPRASFIKVRKSSTGTM